MGKRSSGSRGLQQNSSKKPTESTLDELDPDFPWMPSYADEDTWGRGQTYGDQTYIDVSPARSCDSVVQQTSIKKKPRALRDLGPTLEELKYGLEPDGTVSGPCPWNTAEDTEAMRQRWAAHGSDDEDHRTPSPEAVAEHRRRSRPYAEAGLQHYNKKNGTDYELVDALEHKLVVDRELGVHCNFTAMKPGGGTELFFAELYGADGFPRRFIVLTCRRLLKGKTKAFDGCQSCGGPRSTIVHPTYGFRMGYYEYLALPNHRTLRSHARAGWL